MKIVDTISIAELTDMAENMYGDMVKAVVDVRQRLLVVDAEFHADEEQLLLEKGSKQADLWGLNLYPEKHETPTFIEFDSMINIRPKQNNRSRDVEDASIRKQITAIVGERVTK